jgi:hypothetical protein
MSRARARSPKPVPPSTADVSDAVNAADLGPRPTGVSKSAVEMETARLLVWDLVDEWGEQSFPASDPPANW